MGDEYPKVKVAAVHAASAFLDRDGSVEKACRLIKESAAQGARLIVFPESFIPGYPYWIWTHTALNGAKLFHELFSNSVEIDSEAVARLGTAAREAEAYVIMGVTEREGTTLYNTILYFDDRGQVIGRHRKLSLTHVERIIWARGDGAGLKVHHTPLGRIGGLICGEHSMDLVRYALINQHEQIHIALWPALSAVSYNPRAHLFDSLSETAARYHAFAAQAFVINVQSRIDEDAIAKMGFSGQPDMIRTGGGWSAIISPDSQILAGPHKDTEAILYAELDLAHIVTVKHIYDSAGHYARPDVVDLVVKQPPG